MTYILAEVASAHMGDPGLCREIIQAAYEAGADGVKVQIWTKDEVKGMDDKYISCAEWKDIILPGHFNHHFRHLYLQVYGSASSKFANERSHYIYVIDARDKLWKGKPIIGRQLYPTPVEASLLWKVGEGCGYADHSKHDSSWAFAAPLIAMERGAAMIEKHICMDREKLKERSKDWVSSLEPNEFAEFVQFIRQAEQAL